MSRRDEGRQAYLALLAKRAVDSDLDAELAGVSVPTQKSPADEPCYYMGTGCDCSCHTPGVLPIGGCC